MNCVSKIAFVCSEILEVGADAVIMLQYKSKHSVEWRVDYSSFLEDPEWN